MISTSRKVWEWVTGDVERESYHLIRFTTGLGAALNFGAWAYGSGPGKALGRSFANTLEMGSAAWHVALYVGFTAAMLMIGGRGGRLAALTVFLCLQACGGYMTAWEGRALQLAAGVLVFVGPGKLVSAWPLRILQIQLPIGYFIAVLAKLLIEEHWRELHAFVHIISNPGDHHVWPQIPLWAAPAFDVAGIAIELVAGVLLFAGLIPGKRALQRAGLVASMILHFGIALFIPTGLFLFAVAPFWAAASSVRKVPTWAVRVSWVLSVIVAVLGAVMTENPFVRVS